MRAYAALYDRGFVHSFEVGNADGGLVGGGYSVTLGRMFFTESQLSHESNTSKVAFAALNRHLSDWGYALNDGKKHTAVLEESGFTVIQRAEFLTHLAAGTKTGGKSGRWRTEFDTAQVADWQPRARAKAA